MNFPYLNWLNESMNYMEYPQNTITFVTDTSLQRAFKKRLLENGEIGTGRGLFFIKDGNFIK